MTVATRHVIACAAPFHIDLAVLDNKWPLCMRRIRLCALASECEDDRLHCKFYVYTLYHDTSPPATAPVSNSGSRPSQDRIAVRASAP